MIKAVLFDMDGVLVDTEKKYIEVEAQLCAALGIICDAETKKQYVGSGPMNMWTDFKKKYVFAQTPEEMTEEELRIMTEHYISGDLIAIKPTLDFLIRCAKEGIKVAVATSSNSKNAAAVVNRLGIKEHVGAIVGGDMVKAPKPAPDIFLMAAEKLNVNPSECLVVEDSANGIEAAKRAGMKTIGFKSEDNSQDLNGADIVLASLADAELKILKSFTDI